MFEPGRLAVRPFERVAEAASPQAISLPVFQFKVNNSSLTVQSTVFRDMVAVATAESEPVRVAATGSNDLLDVVLIIIATRSRSSPSTSDSLTTSSGRF